MLFQSIKGELFFYKNVTFLLTIEYTFDIIILQANEHLFTYYPLYRIRVYTNVIKMQRERMDMPDNLLKHLAEVDYRFFIHYLHCKSKKNRMGIRETSKD